MKREYWSLFFIISVFFSSNSFTQTASVKKNKSPASSHSSTIISADTQWEYLVICFGNTYFDEAEKTKGYYSLIKDDGKEGISLQKSLDGLGKLGWELVDVVGIISGDQELILKRKYSPLNKQTDESVVKGESEKFEKDLTAQIDRERQESAQNEKLLNDKKILVDMDKVEEDTLIEEERKQFLDYCSGLAESFKKENFGDIKEVNSNFRFDISISCDLTKDFLANGNEYRSSSVKQYFKSLQEKVDNLIDKNKLGYRTLGIDYTGYIQLDGKKNTVYTYSIDYFDK